MPACAQTASTSANTPIGAASNIQRTITIMVSAMPWQKPMTCARRSSCTRVRANPKNSANTTTGSIAPCAAAMMALLGTMEPIQSASAGAPAAPAGGSVPCSVAVSASLGGTIASTSGATMAA